MPAAPECPQCGSRNITYPGFVSFHWSKGGWRPIRGSAEMATDLGAAMLCQGCGARLQCDDINEPMTGIEVESS
jgi:transcription elongation factor Elf1